MQTIGLIAAMPSESQALLRQIHRYKRLRLGLLSGAAFQSGGRENILVTSGMGIRRAGEAARLLLDQVHPACLVSFGIAGAVRPDLNIGDIILAVQNYFLEDSNLGPSKELAQLSREGKEILDQELPAIGVRFFSGTALTTRGSQATSGADGLLNPVLEMETAGILQASEARQTPLVVLRSISDGPKAPIPLDLQEVMDEDGNLLPGRMMRQVFKNPGIVFKSGSMLKNSRLAADHAALAVMTLLSLSTPFWA